MAPSAAEADSAASSSGRLLVLYASQTGNAMDAAERVGREAERGGFPAVDVLSMDGFDPVSSKHLSPRSHTTSTCETVTPLLVRAESLAQRAVRGLRRVHHGAGGPPGFHEGLEILIHLITSSRLDCLSGLWVGFRGRGFGDTCFGRIWARNGLRGSVMQCLDSGIQATRSTM